MTDEDKNLLELAAKAACVSAYWSTDGSIQARPMFVIHGRGAMGGMPYEHPWNPLKDDGDTLRLAVQLGFKICSDHDATLGEFCEVFYHPRKYARQKSCIEYHKDHPDRFAATRRAIVRAAAEIGKAQQ